MSQDMNTFDIDETTSTSDDAAARVLEQFAQIASACNDLCSLGYGHGWPIRLDNNTNSPECSTDPLASPTQLPGTANE